MNDRGGYFCDANFKPNQAERMGGHSVPNSFVLDDDGTTENSPTVKIRGKSKLEFNDADSMKFLIAAKLFKQNAPSRPSKISWISLTRRDSTVVDRVEISTELSLITTFPYSKPMRTLRNHEPNETVIVLLLRKRTRKVVSSKRAERVSRGIFRMRFPSRVANSSD